MDMHHKALDQDRVLDYLEREDILCHIDTVHWNNNAANLADTKMV